MGLDLLDLDCRIEKRFGVRIGIDAWEAAAAGRIPFDITASEVVRLVLAALETASVSGPADRDTLEAHGVPVLDYAAREPDRRGWPRPLTRHGPPPPVNDVWNEVRNVIAATLCVPASQIEPRSWLVQDLGMQC